MSAAHGDLRITHVITGLRTGGAETILLRLLERTCSRGIDSTVISLTGEGTLGGSIESLGPPVRALGIRPRPLPGELARLRAAIRDTRPDVVQTWLLHSNVLGGLASRFGTRAPVAWGIHITSVDPEVFGRRAALVARTERALSRAVPARIVACSRSALELMHDRGYPERKIELIPNGFDLERFHPDPEARRAVRAELGIDDAAPLVGHVARFHPVKDHRTLLAAAREVVERAPGARFVLCGSGVGPENAELAAWAAPLGDAVLMLGERSDVDRLYRALDVAVSSSAGEALPLAVGEAMASGVPVAATRGGDSAAMVGETGRIVPVGDPAALGGAIAELLELPAGERARLGERARERIGELYDLEAMVTAYEALWRGLARGSGAARGA